MEYVSLGRTGLKVSRLCLGTANFGPHADEETSHLVMDEAVNAGINFFDTADIYGMMIDPNQGYHGLTEDIIGRWLTKEKERREKIVLATKVWGVMDDGPNDRGLSAYHIKQACENSLKRLRTDHIDLYQMHNYDPSANIDEILQAMECLIKEGKILYVGSSNWPAWEITRFNLKAEEKNLFGLVSEQCCFSLAARKPEHELLPAARLLGVGILPWGPLSGGILGGALKKADSGRRSSPGVQKVIEQYRPQLEKWEAFCDMRDWEPAHAALAWLLARPEVTSPILGPRNPKQLKDSLPALDIKLNKKDLEELDSIWPPFGAGPHAYAL